MKAKHFFIVFFALSFSFHISCTKENNANLSFIEDESSNKKTESEVDGIKILSLSNVIKKRATSTRIDILIVEFEGWGRAKYNCNSGWGLCRAVWFPEFRSASDENQERLGAIVEVDSETGQRYIEIFLAETPTPPIQVDGVEYDNINNLKFVIDEDITIDESSVLSAGSYSFNENLGEHGGYKIYFK